MIKPKSGASKALDVENRPREEQLGATESQSKVSTTQTPGRSVASRKAQSPVLLLRSLGWFGTFKGGFRNTVSFQEVSSLQSWGRYFLKVRQGNHLIWASIRWFTCPIVSENHHCKATAPVSPTAWHFSQTLMTGWGSRYLTQAAAIGFSLLDPESGSLKMCQATT